MTYVTRAKFSERQAGRAVAIDQPALSPAARTDVWTINAGNSPFLVRNKTFYYTFPVGTPNSNGNAATAGIKVTGVEIMFTTVPAQSGGASTVQIDSVTTAAGATTNIVASTTLLSGLVNSTPAALTLAATNPAVTIPTSYLLVTIACNDNAVGTPDAGGTINIYYENVEDAIINDTNVLAIGN